MPRRVEVVEGSFVLSDEVEVVFENGEKVREKWDGKDYWIKYKYVKPTKLVKATVDPDQKVPLDLNWKNNTRTVTQQERDQSKIHGGYWGMIKFALKPQ